MADYRGGLVIPSWNAEGIFSPIDPASPTGLNRSPYEVNLVELVARFATSNERCMILRGFLDYRAAIHAAGLTLGFHWVDGSFCEDIESRQLRPPGDIDVVTFFAQTGPIVQDPNVPFWDHPWTKLNYKVDSALVDLGASPDLIVEHAAYWYGVWSHCRDNTWKGFLRVDLDPSSDSAALAELASATAVLASGGTP